MRDADGVRERSSFVRYQSPRIPLVRNTALVAVAAGLGLLLWPYPVFQDFIQYWSAARVLLSSGNPYDASAMLLLQQAIWPDELHVIRMWNPPWVLALIIPLGFLDPSTAGLIWISTHLLVFLACGNWLWRYFGGGEIGAWLFGAVTLFFPATVLALGMGQISPFMLLGLCGFLHFVAKERWALAGAVAALTLVKPHWVSLFWLAVILWSLRGRRSVVVLGTVGAVLSALGIGLMVNPALMGQYLDAVTSEPPFFFIGPNAGVLFRLFFGWERSWLQFLPTALGGVWLFRYWMRRRDSWEWGQEVSLVVLASALVTAYGWPYDQVVFLIPLASMVRTLVQRPSPLVWLGLSVFISAGVLTALFASYPVLVHPVTSDSDPMVYALSEPNEFWHILTTPLYLVGFLLAQRPAGPAASPPGAASS